MKVYMNPSSAGTFLWFSFVFRRRGRREEALIVFSVFSGGINTVPAYLEARSSIIPFTVELKMFHYMILSSVLLITASSVQGQCEKPIVGGNRVLTEKSSLISSFTIGTTVYFKCSLGYTTVNGSRSITCNGTHWTELELLCKGKSCGHPGDILHGGYSMPDGILMGATITASCDKGYRLASTRNIRTCRADGWDGREHSCEAVKCVDPPDVLHGRMENKKEWYNYGEVVTYSCIGDRFLNGSIMLSCSDDETFKPDAPQCVDVQCETPEIRNAYKVEGKTPPYKYGNFLVYKCDRGYKMNGSEKLVCTELGWSPPPPVCDVVTCSKPKFTSQGRVHYAPLQEVYEYGQEVKCSCTTGFYLSGAQTIACSENGTFRPSPPECLEVTCKEPYLGNAVIIEGKAPRYVYNQSIRYQCKKGYSMQGSDYLTCMETRWTPPLPQCQVVTCNVTDVKNAAITERKSSYQYGNVIRYKCDEGYIRNGADELICTEHGWSLPPPTCNEVTCDVIDVINATITERKAVYKYKDVVQYRCHKGYKMEGIGLLKCLEKGWEPDPPRCRITRKNYIGVALGIGAVALAGLIGGGIGAYFHNRNKKASKQSPVVVVSYNNSAFAEEKTSEDLTLLNTNGSADL